MKTTCSFLSICLLTMLPGTAEVAGPAEQLEVLRQHGVATDTPGVLAYLQRLRPSAEQEDEMAELVAQLGDVQFVRREGAAKTLATYGEAARKLLTEAAESDEPEVRSRARKLLERLDSDSGLLQSLAVATFEVLESRRDGQAAPVVLATIPVLSERRVWEAAAEALWATADASHEQALRAALNHVSVLVRAAAIVALEIAAGEGAVEQIAPYLNSQENQIRLAAVRALIDRVPKRAVEVLIELAGEEALEVSWQANALLKMKTGHSPRIDGDGSAGEAWRKWSNEELAGAALDTELGPKRLDLSAGGDILEEHFERDSKSLAKGYGLFRYEADNGGPAAVGEGKLRINGDNPEGDQRLFITSQIMTGRERWPDRMEVRVKLAGEAGNNFGWHMGVSIGNVKALFHPGLKGGHFRAETTDDHFYLFPNEMMKFQPVNDVMHEMIIKVRKTEMGAKFDVCVKAGQGGGKPHEKTFTVTDEQLGDYDRVGLERSGRTGADALFDSVVIRLGAQ